MIRSLKLVPYHKIRRRIHRYMEVFVGWRNVYPYTSQQKHESCPIRGYPKEYNKILCSALHEQNLQIPTRQQPQAQVPSCPKLVPSKTCESSQLAQSVPDLNLIKHMWKTLERAMKDRGKKKFAQLIRLMVANNVLPLRA